MTDEHEEAYRPLNPDGDYDVRLYIGYGHLYEQWLRRISEKDRLVQKERLEKYGKDLPAVLPNGEKITRSGYRMGLRYLPPAERSGGRRSGTKDKAQRLVNKPFDVSERKRFISILEKSGNVSQAAAEAGYSRFTIIKHANKSPEFKQAIEDAKARLNGRVRQSVLDRILNGEEIIERDSKGDIIKTTTRAANSALVVKWLESTQSEEFGKRSEVTNLHIGDDSSSNSRLLALASKLNITLPDNSKDGDMDDEDIVDIN